jgi:polyferredoxin
MSRKNKIGPLVLGLVFIMMCMFRLWFTIYLIFAFALVLTVYKGNRSYCNKYCPVGTLQDLALEKTTKKAHAKKYNIWFTLLFWIILIAITIIYWQVKSVLWHRLLIFMMASALTALYFQNKKAKRYWCTNLCPLGHVMDIYIQNKR